MPPTFDAVLQWTEYLLRGDDVHIAEDDYALSRVLDHFIFRRDSVDPDAPGPSCLGRGKRCAAPASDDVRSRPRRE